MTEPPVSKIADFKVEVNIKSPMYILPNLTSQWKLSSIVSNHLILESLFPIFSPIHIFDISSYPLVVFYPKNIEKIL